MKRNLVYCRDITCNLNWVADEYHPSLYVRMKDAMDEGLVHGMRLRCDSGRLEDRAEHLDMVLGLTNGLNLFAWAAIDNKIGHCPPYDGYVDDIVAMFADNCGSNVYGAPRYMVRTLEKSGNKPGVVSMPLVPVKRYKMNRWPGYDRPQATKFAFRVYCEGIDGPVLVAPCTLLLKHLPKLQELASEAVTFEYIGNNKLTSTANRDSSDHREDASCVQEAIDNGYTEILLLDCKPVPSMATDSTEMYIRRNTRVDDLCRQGSLDAVYDMLAVTPRGLRLYNQLLADFRVGAYPSMPLPKPDTEQWIKIK